MKDDETGIFTEDKCTNARLIPSMEAPEYVRCECSQLGLIAGHKKWKPLPLPSKDLNISVHFWDNPDRCTKRLFPAFKSKFANGLVLDINNREKQLNGTLKLKKNRIRVGKCTPAQIYNKDLINIVNFVIRDDINHLRNKRIKQHIWTIIQEQRFKVKLAKVSVPQFDPNQTTPKPPPATIPPIGEVGVSWSPIITAIIVIFVFFILLAFLTCIYHSYLLKQGKFTEKNSDKPEEPNEEDEDEEEEEKAKKEVMANIMDDVVAAGDNPTNRHHKTSEWRLRYTKQVHPINDIISRNTSSDKHSPSSDYYRESAQLDRLALDDSSDDDASCPTSSRAELFTAQSIKNQEKLDGKDGKESPITQVEI